MLRKPLVHTRTTGNRGEDIACLYLRNNGFTIKDRNYLKPWGELDIVAQKDGLLHFIEVKSVTVDFSSVNDSHRPEDNVHGLKVKRMRRMIETYLDKNRLFSAPFQVDVICVYLDRSKKTARIKWMKDIIL